MKKIISLLWEQIRKSTGFSWGGGVAGNWSWEVNPKKLVEGGLL